MRLNIFRRRPLATGGVIKAADLVSISEGTCVAPATQIEWGLDYIADDGVTSFPTLAFEEA